MTLTAQLAQLETASLLQVAATYPELEYLFRHALTRDAAYTSLLRRQRRAVHRAAGEVLEAMCTTDALRASAAPLLAEHLQEAGEPARALDYWELAADHALAQYALPEAIAHLGHALALAPDVPALSPARWAALYLKRGRAQYSNTEWQAAWDTHAALLALGEHLDDDTLRLAALLELANQRAIMNPQFNAAEARRLSQQALDLARRLADPAAEAKALWISMRAHSMEEGGSAQALAAGQQSLALARAHALDEQAAYTLSDLQYAYRSAGQNQLALAVLAEARLYWRASRQAHMLADNLNQGATLALALGDYTPAEAWAQEALTLSVATQNLSQQFLSRTVLAQVLLDLGDFGRARVLLDGLNLAAIGWFAHPLLTIRALLWAQVGRVDQAIANLEPDLPPDTPNPLAALFRYGQLSYRAYLCTQAGQWAAAEAAVRQAHALPVGLSNFGFENFGYYLPLAEGALAQRRQAWPSAHAHYQALINRLTTTGPQIALAEAQWRHGEMLAAQDAPEAEAVLTQAVQTTERYGQRRVAWRAWHALAGWQAAHGQPAAGAWAHARDHLSFIIDGLTEPDTRASFLNLPDVRAVLHSPP